MYLKSLELQGFKSFPDKTKLTFENGATVIVGPNGSGKSNISDAMRWVLGEISTKNIRGSKMEDIIFGGSESRKQMGYAEVSVTFDNRDTESRLECDYDEVTVTRRYYRSGDSEYYINRNPVRLRDIYELFMNTGIGRDGYSIIGQGKIAEIISRKSDERRSIFEDASGIAKYRHKKSETERKLSDVEDNMTRINDVFAEVSAQVVPLEKEADKASRAIELLDTKKRVDIQLWLFDTEKLREEIGVAEKLYNESSFNLNAINDVINSYEAQNEKLFEISQSNKYESEQLLARINEQTKVNHNLDSEYKVAETNIAHTGELLSGSAELIKSYERSIERENEGISLRQAKIGELSEKLEKQKAEHKEATEAQANAKKRAEELDLSVAEALNDIKNYEKEATDVKVRLSVIENARKNDDGKNSVTLEEIKKYDKMAEELSLKIARIEKTISSYEGNIAEADAEIAQKSEILENKYTERDSIDDKTADIRIKIDTASHKIENLKTMEEQLEGYGNSVKFVMKEYAEGRITDKNGNRCGKIYGPLSKVISTDGKYVTAIETALAANIQHIVVDNEETAKNAMYALKKADSGRATFFPITSMQPQSATYEMEEASKLQGFIAYADELVDCESKFKNIVSSLLGRTVVFDNLDNATEMAKATKFRVKAVTLDGQQIQAGGSFTGGSVKNKGGFLSRGEEIKKLEAEVKANNKELSELCVKLDALDKEITSLEDAKNRLEDRKKILLVMKSGEATTLEQTRAKLEANNTLGDKLRADYGNIIEQRQRYEDESGELAAKLREFEKAIAEISEFRNAKDIERGELLEISEKASERITELYIKISETEKDIATEQTFLDSNNNAVKSFYENIAVQNEKIKSFKAQIEAFEISQKENRESLTRGEGILEELNRKRGLLESDSFEFEKKLSAMNTKIREKRNEQELVIRENTKNENKLNALRNEQDKLATKLWDEYEITRAEAVAFGFPEITQATRAETAAKQIECRNKLRAIGSVDLDAVNKYKEVKERYDYMSAQIKDLMDSKAELVKIITSLESEMKTAFVDSFNKINEAFGRTFNELFGGGTAEILLTEPEDVLSSGIEIKATPPGKKIKSLMQLSGGEQSFVAIALVFAILQVNPTPFCIFDEIEAALDEVNVSRFSEYIKRYSNDTQFVIITHRRGTMEAATRLYGVTMPERGISKVLSLDVADIAKKKGDDWDGILGQA